MDNYTAELLGFSKGGMPARNKKNFRSTKSGAGMTQAGVKAYRRMNPGSKLSTAVTEDKPGPKRSARRKSFCARSAGQMKMFPKAAKDPNSRLRQARRRWKCLSVIRFLWKIKCLYINILLSERRQLILRWKYSI
jgi:hypothetical protein